MNFCCGADMLLTIAHLKQDSLTMTNVPVLFCLTCEKIMVHPDVELEYEMLKEYALGDQAQEVDLEPYINPNVRSILYDPKNHADALNKKAVLQERIDQALELFLTAKALDDLSWQTEIAERIKTLNHKKSGK